MRKNKLTEYGVKVKTKLCEMNQTQEWLVSEVKKESDMFIDSALLNRILTGRTNSSLVPVINRILGIKPE